jgi:hypothetical protein
MLESYHDRCFANSIQFAEMLESKQEHCFAKSIQFAEILEYDNESQLIGQTVANFTHPEDILVDSNLLEEINAISIPEKIAENNNVIITKLTNIG